MVASAKTQAHFVADGSTAGLDKNDLTVDRESVLADGKEAATFLALVKDAKGNPVAGLDMKWSSDAGNLIGRRVKPTLTALRR